MFSVAPTNIITITITVIITITAIIVNNNNNRNYNYYCYHYFPLTLFFKNKWLCNLPKEKHIPVIFTLCHSRQDKKICAQKFYQQGRYVKYLVLWQHDHMKGMLKEQRALILCWVPAGPESFCPYSPLSCHPGMLFCSFLVLSSLLFEGTVHAVSRGAACVQVCTCTHGHLRLLENGFAENHCSQENTLPWIMGSRDPVLHGHSYLTSIMSS